MCIRDRFITIIKTQIEQLIKTEFTYPNICLHIYTKQYNSINSLVIHINNNIFETPNIIYVAGVKINFFFQKHLNLPKSPFYPSRKMISFNLIQ